MRKEETAGIGLMVISNSACSNGFASIFYPGVLAKLAERKGNNLIIIPSSIHEAIVFADYGEIETEELNKMITNGKGQLVYELKAKIEMTQRKTLSVEQMDSLQAELKGTGVGIEAVKERYQIQQPEEMSAELYQKAMKALARTKSIHVVA